MPKSKLAKNLDISNLPLLSVLKLGLLSNNLVEIRYFLYQKIQVISHMHNIFQLICTFTI